MRLECGHACAGNSPDVVAALQYLCDDLLVFFRLERAGRIYKPPAACEAIESARKKRHLPPVEFG